MRQFGVQKEAIEGEVCYAASHTIPHPAEFYLIWIKARS